MPDNNTNKPEKTRRDQSGQDDGIFENAFNYAAIGMALVAPDGTWLKVNDSLCAIIGYAEEEILSKTFQDITHPDDINQDLEFVNQALSGEIDAYQMEKRYFHKNGHVVHILLSVSLVRNNDGTPKFFISQIQDITQKKKLEDDLTRMAIEDHLTKVANRRYFLEHASREIARGARFKEPQALIMIDIDHFKMVNDTYGHDAGDEVLKAVAHKCKSTLRAVDIFCRFGGEEFAALLLNTDSEMARVIADRIRANVENFAITINGALVTCTVSLGVTHFVGGKDDIATRIKEADKALYQAKNLGRNRVQCNFDETDDGEEREGMRASFVKLTWKKEYECGNSRIDAQHKTLFNLSNELLSSILSGLAKSEVEPIAQELANHVVIHFRDEEEIFRSSEFHLADQHAEIHKELIEGMHEMLDRFKCGELSVGELFDFLATKVVAEHLLYEDRKFFPYILTD